MIRYKYWNREESEHGQHLCITKVNHEAHILSLSALDDPPNDALHKAGHNGTLPKGATLLGISPTVEEFADMIPEGIQPNVAFVSPSCPNASLELPKLLERYPSLEWVHVRSAGIDFVVSPELSANKSVKIFTNAKGQFSSTLAEYTMMACSYFAKNLPRLIRQKSQKHWGKYNVDELRGKTMGIVGYGDIGRACAKLAHVYGMRIVALRRNPDLCNNDPLCDVVLGADKESLHALCRESDYIVCSAPSTVETKGMVSAEAFENMKENAVFINLGRGPVVDEEALIEALRSGKLGGAALDVFMEEPLPQSSALWDLDNVLISPHNMDQTATFMHEATEFFVNENLPRFICGQDLLNPVDTAKGY